MTSILSRFRDAYLRMARDANYRPMAPGDGMGNLHLTPAELADEDRLEREAHEYAVGFHAEDDNRTFSIGCSNFSTNRSLVWTIEAARSLCGGADELALRLLRLAIDDIKDAQAERRKRAA
jgi:hypothetical protein